MRKRMNCAAFVLAGCLLLCGCGGSGNEVFLGANHLNSIGVYEDASFVYHLEGVLDQSYYSVSELSEMAEEEFIQYHAGRSLNKMEYIGASKTDGGTGTGAVGIEYRFYDDYILGDFTECDFFFDTVDAAVADGYRVGEQSFVLSKDGSVLSGSEVLAKYGKCHILITNFQGAISGYLKVKAVAGAGRVTDASKNSTYVDTTGLSEGYVYILYTK